MKLRYPQELIVLRNMSKFQYLIKYCHGYILSRPLDAVFYSKLYSNTNNSTTNKN